MALTTKVITMKHKGYSYDEIAKEVNLGKRVIINMCARYRYAEQKMNEKLKNEKKAAEPKEEPKFPEIKVDGKVVGTIKPMNDWIKKSEEWANNNKPVEKVLVVTKTEEPKIEFPATPAAEVKEKTLDDFTPRQIFKHLDRLGYRFGDVYCVKTVKVNIQDIIGS